jgi:16S rRNA (guanine966-N2)-methyltransferase
MKIISGKHKNRIIATIKAADYRPTTTKFREALFSILSSGEFLASQPIIDASVLDLFAGTGILSFETLSRGAKSATLIDINIDYLKAAEKFAEKIGEKNNIRCQNLNIQILPKATTQYSLVFMDPPYHQNLCAKTLVGLIKNNWLADKAIIAMEMEKSAKIEFDKFPNLHLIKEKIYGNNKLIIMQNVIAKNRTT